MTPELIKQWASESGFIFANDAKLDNHAQWQANVFAKFAALVAAHQRELDAKVCENYQATWQVSGKEFAAAVRQQATSEPAR